ncbi:MAG: transposase family protein [Planctomycetaceae bacterium]|jgi:hypothetical protein|nr:transposase family protein [Planctomycetaceae bacterium]
MTATILCRFAEFLKAIPDPRSRQGVSHPPVKQHCRASSPSSCLVSSHACIARIVRWSAIYWTQLKEPLLGFKSDAPPDETTISRVLAKLPLEHLRQGLIAFYQLALANEHSLTAAVDGKTNKQILDKNGDVLQMRNVFVHDSKITLLQVLQEHHLDYVFQIKENQKTLMMSSRRPLRTRTRSRRKRRAFQKKGVRETRKIWLDSDNAEWAASFDVKNCLHLIKDRWRDEDKHYLSMPGLSEKFTCLLSRSLNVLRFLRKGKEPLTAVSARVRTT